MVEGTVVVETLQDEKCTERFVLNAVENVKFLFDQETIGRYTAVTVLKKEKVETMIPGDQEVEITEGQILKKEGRIREVAIEEIHAETVDNSWIS